ncbi:MAG: rRNA pseudouridine synthase [Planctomycetes bacterium]|nr:rRNA pseudouridine synthase [Planctomycetota bacterium]
MRLVLFLARAGVASRRKAGLIVKQGLVLVNGVPVANPAHDVDPAGDRVVCEGKPVRPPDGFVYYLLHKPKGVVSGRNPQGARRTVFDLVPPVPRTFSAGRLDTDSSGLLLLTNDGDLVNRLTHPRYKVEKVYRVMAEGKLDDETLNKLAGGIHLSEGKVFGKFTVVKKTRSGAVMDVVLTQGVNRQVRRMLARVGLKVKNLMRTRFGPFRLGKIPVGDYVVMDSRRVNKMLGPSAETAGPASGTKRTRPRKRSR